MSETGSHGGDEAAAVAARVDAVLRRDTGGQFTLTRPSGWIAIPIEGSSHLSRPNIERFATAFRSLGVEEVYAVALELRGEIEPVRRFPASEAGLDAFNRDCGHFNHALTTAEVVALVICTTDDYLVVCGPEHFVRLAVGADPKSTLEEFRQYATTPGWTPPVRNMLESVWRALSTAEVVLTFPET
jgi:hypothetical protein